MKKGVMILIVSIISLAILGFIHYTYFYSEGPAFKRIAVNIAKTDQKAIYYLEKFPDSYIDADFDNEYLCSSQNDPKNLCIGDYYWKIVFHKDRQSVISSIYDENTSVEVWIDKKGKVINSCNDYCVLQKDEAEGIKEKQLVGGCAGVSLDNLQECCNNWAQKNNIVKPALQCAGEWEIKDNKCSWKCGIE
jgi:uncharacterized protein YpmB